MAAPLTDADLVAAEVETCLRVPFCPHRPTAVQRKFLRLSTLEGNYGGAAGGGKSDALLMAALRYVDQPGYDAILMRRTFADLALPGSLIPRSQEWLSGTAAKWNERDKRWTFPSGASLSFGYCETANDRYRYQSTEFDFVGWDELTQFEEVVYRYLFSRVRRRKGSPYVPRVRSATNPGGVGHRWVKKRFGITEKGAQSPKWLEDDGSGVVRDVLARDRPFIPAKLHDNPHVDEESYRRSLAQLDTTTREQLEHGLWVLDDATRIYRFNPDAHYVEALPTSYADGRRLDSTEWKHILAIDLGASASSATTGIVEMSWHPYLTATYVTRAWREKGMIPSTLADLVRARMVEHEDLVVVIDEGALGHGYGEEMRRRHSLPVYAAEKRDKAPTRRLMNGAIERGELLMVRGQCDELEDELLTLIWDAAGRDAAPGLADHCSDALLYGWRWSRSWASEVAPKDRPAYGSSAWYEAQREANDARDREAYQERQQLEDFERW